MIQTIFNYAVSILIFLSATAYVAGQGIGETQLMVFKIGVPVIFLTSLLLNKKRNIVNKWFVYCVGWAFVTTMFLKGQPQMIAIEPFVYLFLGLLLYLTISNYLTDLKPILNGICWAVGFQALIVLLQKLGLDPICMNDSRTGINTHLVGVFGFKYVFSAWMAIATPVLLFNKRYLFGILSFVMCILGMSLAPIGLMFASLVIGAYFIKPRYALYSLIAIILLAGVAWIFVLNNPSNQSLYHKAWLRWHLETKFLPKIFSKPVLGWGLGSFKYIGPSVWNMYTGTYGTMVDPWSNGLGTAIEGGIPFTMLMFATFWDGIKRFFKSKKAIGVCCSLLIIPIGCLFHDYFMHASLSTLILCLYASAYELYEV